VYDSFFDHTKFLLKFSRYKAALQAATPEQQAIELKRAGYATAPDYATAIIDIIDRYNLKKLDKQKPVMQRMEIFLLVIVVVIALYFITTKFKFSF